MRFDSFEEAYLWTLDLVYGSPQYVNAPRGSRSRERLNHHFTLANPRERVCYLPVRRTNIVFNFAEVLWYLSADNTLDYISYYASWMPRYSADGKIMTGTAYGPKIFNFGERNVNQWEEVVRHLSEEDSDSKRAFIQIFDADQETLSLDNPDVSCTTGLQFLVREGRLHTTVFMRANDAFRGVVSDVFSFTFLQEFMARQLGVGLGDYHHNVGSIHVYETDDPWVEQVLAETESSETESSETTRSFRFPELPAGDNWEQLSETLGYERPLRENRLRLTPKHLERSGLSDYWRQVVLLFGLYRVITHDDAFDRGLYERLWPVYRYLVANKWAPELRQEAVEAQVPRGDRR